MDYPFQCISDFIFVETPLESADIILVPGSDQQGLMLKAAELYHKGLAPLILPSGGGSPKLPLFSSEWEFLFQTGISSSVPYSSILKEDMARNTFENARFSYRVLLEQGLKVKKAIIVCKNYHSRRALMTYQTQFPKGIEFLIAPIIDDTGIIRDNWFLDSAKINMVMQEVTKIGRYFDEEIEGLYEKYK